MTAVDKHRVFNYYAKILVLNKQKKCDNIKNLKKKTVVT